MIIYNYYKWTTLFHITYDDFWSFIGSKTMILATMFISLNLESTCARYTCTYVSNGMHGKPKSLNVPESFCWAFRHISNSAFKISVDYRWNRHMNSIILAETQEYKNPDLTIFQQILNPCLFIKKNVGYSFGFFQKKNHRSFYSI